MTITEQVYLDHTGVKGMKWGVRRAQKALGGTAGRTGHTIGKKIKEVRTDPEKRAEFKKVAKRVAVGTVIGGAAAAGLIFAHRHVKLNQVRAALEKQRSSDEATKRLFELQRDLKVKDIFASARMGKVTNEQAGRLATLAVRDAHNKIIRKTGGRLLRGGY